VSLRATTHPEFDAWRWHEYWVPLDVVIEFKRDVYQQALLELSRFVFKANRAAHKAAKLGPRGAQSAPAGAKSKGPRPANNAASVRARGDTA